MQSRNSDADFPCQPEQPLQRAVTAWGHQQRPRFRMSLKKETGRPACVAPIQWTKGGEKRADQDDLQQVCQSGQEKEETHDERKTNAAKDSQVESNSELQRARAPSLNAEDACSHDGCATKCLSSSSTSHITTREESRSAVHSKLERESGRPCNSSKKACTNEEALVECDGKGDQIEKKKFQMKAAEHGSGVSISQLEKAALEKREATWPLSLTECLQQSRKPSVTTEYAGTRSDTVNNERVTPIQDGQFERAVQRDANVYSRRERDDDSCGTVALRQKKNERNAGAKHTERGGREEERDTIRCGYRSRRNSSSSEDPEHRGRRRRENTHRSNSSSTHGTEETVSVCASERKQRQGKAHGSDVSRHASDARWRRSGSVKRDSSHGQTLRPEHFSLDTAQKPSVRHRKTSDESRSQKEEQGAGRDNYRHGALYRGQQQRTEHEDANSEAKERVAVESKRNESNIGEKDPSTRSHSHGRGVKNDREREAEGKREDSKVTEERKHSEEVSRKSYSVHVGARRRRESGHREHGMRRADDGERVKGVHSSSGNRKKHCRRSRSRSHRHSHSLSRSRHKNEMHRRCCRDKSADTSTKERRSSTEARDHKAVRRSRERGSLSQNERLPSSKVTGQRATEEKTRALVSTAPHSESLASSSRTATTYCGPGDRQPTKDRGRSPFPTYRKEEGKTAFASKSCRINRMTVMSLCGQPSEKPCIEGVPRSHTHRTQDHDFGAEARGSSGIGQEKGCLGIGQQKTLNIRSPSSTDVSFNDVKCSSTGEDAKKDSQYPEEEDSTASPRRRHHRREDQRLRPHDDRDGSTESLGRRDSSTASGRKSHSPSTYRLHSGERERHKHRKSHHHDRRRSEHVEKDVHSKNKSRDDERLKHGHGEKRYRRPSGSWDSRHSDHRRVSPKAEKETTGRLYGSRPESNTDGCTRERLSRERRRSSDGKTARSYRGRSGGGGEFGGASLSDSSDLGAKRREIRGAPVTWNRHEKNVEHYCGKEGEARYSYSVWSERTGEPRKAGWPDRDKGRQTQGDENDAVSRKGSHQRENKTDAENAAEAKERGSEPEIVACGSRSAISCGSSSEDLAGKGIEELSRHLETRDECSRRARRDLSESSSRGTVVAEMIRRNSKSDRHNRRRKSSHLPTERISPVAFFEQGRSETQDRTVARHKDARKSAQDEVYGGEVSSHKRSRSKEDKDNPRSLKSVSLKEPREDIFGDSANREVHHVSPGSRRWPDNENRCSVATFYHNTTQSISTHQRVQDDTGRSEASSHESARGSDFQKKATPRKDAQEAKTTKRYIGEDDSSKNKVLGEAIASRSPRPGAPDGEHLQHSLQKSAIGETGSLSSAEEISPIVSPAKNIESHSEHSPHSESYLSTVRRRSCSPGESTSLKRTNVETANVLPQRGTRRDKTERISAGEQRDIPHDGPKRHSDASLPAGEQTSSCISAEKEFRPCGDISRTRTGTLPCPPSSCDSCTLPTAVAPVAAAVSTGTASRERFIRAREAEEVVSSSHGNCFVSTSVITGEDTHKAAEPGVSQEAALLAGDISNAEPHKVDSAAVQTRLSPLSTTNVTPGSAMHIPQLLRGLASSLAIARRGGSSRPCAAVNSSSPEGQTNMPQTPESPSSKRQSDLDQDVSLQRQAFPPPKILSCVSPLRPQASYTAPTLPPPPSRAYDRSEVRFQWNPRSRRCSFVPCILPVSAVRSPGMRPCSSSSEIPFSPSAPTSSDTQISSTCLSSVRSQPPVGHSPVILSLRVRPSETTDSRELLHRSSDGHSVASLSGLTVSPTSQPPPAPPTPTRRPPQRQAADSQASFDSLTQKEIQTALHSGKPAVLSVPPMAPVLQQQCDCNFVNTSPKDAVSAVVSGVTRSACDPIILSGSRSAGTAASVDLTGDKCVEDGSVVEPQPHWQRVRKPFSEGPSVSTKEIFAGNIADALGGGEARTISDESVDVRAPTGLQPRRQEMLNAFGQPAHTRQGTILEAKGLRSPETREPSKSQGDLQAGGKRDAQALTSRQPVHGVRTVERVTGSGLPQQRGHETTHLMEHGTSKDVSKTKQAFSREQLLGGVSIKRVKRTRQQPHDAAASVSRPAVGYSTMLPSSTSGTAMAVKQPASTTEEHNTVSGAPVEMNGDRVASLGDHRRGQQHLKSAIAIECANEAADGTEPFPRGSDTVSDFFGGSRPRRDDDSSKTGGGSDNPAYVPLAASKAVLAADGGKKSSLEVAAAVQPRQKEAAAEAAATLRQKQRKAAAEAAENIRRQQREAAAEAAAKLRQQQREAAAEAAAALRQRQRDEHVARYLQDLQARYTVLGDEEAAPTSTGGPVGAHSRSSQSDSSSDSCSSDDSNTNSSTDRASSRSSRSSIDYHRRKFYRSQRGVSEDERVDNAEMAQAYQSSSVEAVSLKARRDTRGKTSVARKREIAVEPSDKSVQQSRKTPARHCEETDSGTDDTDSSVCSIFSPSSSSSDSSRSPVSRRRTHPLQVLDQERRQFFRAAARAACKLHLWEHASVSLFPTTSSGGYRTGAAEVRFSAEEMGMQGRNGAGARQPAHAQPAAVPVEMSKSASASDPPMQSVCMWLRVLLMMRKSLWRAKWANRRAAAAQGTAAAAIAASAASGAYRSYLFDEKWRTLIHRNRVLGKSENASDNRVDGRQDCATKHMDDSGGHLSWEDGDMTVPRALISVRRKTYSDTYMKCKPGSASEEYIPGPRYEKCHPDGMQTHHMSEEERKTTAFLQADVRSSVRSVTTGRQENQVTQSSLRVIVAPTGVRRPHTGGYKSATAAAVLQEMPKAYVFFPHVRRLRRCRQCTDNKWMSASIASTQAETKYDLCDSVNSVASRHIQLNEHNSESSLTVVTRAGGKLSAFGTVAGSAGTGKVLIGDLSESGANIRAPAPDGTHYKLSAHPATGATENAMCDEFQRRVNQCKFFPASYRRDDELKVADGPLKKVLPSEVPQGTDAGAVGLTAPCKEFQEVLGRLPARRRPLALVGECADGVEATWSGSDVSSTRSSSASRSPSVASSDDVYGTVDAGCAGLFLPTHTLEIGQKSTHRTSSSEGFPCVSLSGSKWENTVSSVAYHESMPLGAAGLESGEICICSLSDMRPSCMIPSPQEKTYWSADTVPAAVECVSWKRSARAAAAGEEHLLAVGRRGGTVDVVDIRVGESRRTAVSWEAHTGPVEKLTFLSTAACVTSSPTEMYVRFWDLRGSGTKSCSAAPFRASLHDSSIYASGRGALALPSTVLDTPAKSSYQLGSEQYSITCYSPSGVDGRLVRSVKMNSGVSAFAISPDEELLAVACLCGEVQLLSLPLDPEPCEQLLSFPSVHELDCFSSLCFSRNGRGLLVCGERQFTPRMRAATQLISYPFCEMWDLQDTKQRHKMLVCASFWKHIRRYGSGARKQPASSTILMKDLRPLQQNQGSQQGIWSQEAERLCYTPARPALEEDCKGSRFSVEAPSFELPMSFFPSCLAVSVHANSESAVCSSAEGCKDRRGMRTTKIHNALSCPADQRFAGSMSKSVRRAAQAGNPSYILYLNSRFSSARRGSATTEIQEETATKTARCFASEECVYLQTETENEERAASFKSGNLIQQRDCRQQAGRGVPQPQVQRRRPVTRQFLEELSTSGNIGKPGMAVEDAGEMHCSSGNSEATTLDWAQAASRFSCGPFGGDFRWPCRRFVCDLWRDKVVGVGGPLHLMGAFKQWDASTGYLDSCTVHSVSQSLVSSVAADPRGGPTLLTGGRSPVSGRGALTMWGYFTVPQMEAFGLVKL